MPFRDKSMICLVAKKNSQMEQLVNSDSKFKRVSKTLAVGGGGTAPRRQGQRWADTRPAAAGDLGGRESVRARRGRAEEKAVTRASTSFNQWRPRE